MSETEAPAAETAAPLPPLTSGQAWRVTLLWEDYGGEARVNLLRLAALAVFYVIHLANLYWLIPEATAAVHTPVTAIAAAWGLLAIGIHLCLLRRILPTWLGYLATAADFLLLSLLLLVGDGPKSPMVDALFLIVIGSALRFRPKLVAFATVCAALSYLVVIGNAFFYREELRNARYEQVTFGAVLIVAGVITGQVVRRARALAEAYASRLERRGGDGA